MFNFKRKNDISDKFDMSDIGITELGKGGFMLTYREGNTTITYRSKPTKKRQIILGSYLANSESIEVRQRNGLVVTTKEITTTPDQHIDTLLIIYSYQKGTKEESLSTLKHGDRVLSLPTNVTYGDTPICGFLQKDLISHCKQASDEFRSLYAKLHVQEYINTIRK